MSMNGESGGPRELKVAICIPSSDTWKARMAFQACCMVAQSTAAGVTPMMLNHTGGDAAHNRNCMVAIGLEQGAHAFLFLDADMLFPPDTLLRLLRWKVPIAGADYRFRGPPFAKIGTSPEGPPFPADHVDPPDGLVGRGMLGLGCVLVRRRVFETLPRPWFARTWIKEVGTPDNPDGFATDDCYFFHYCRHHGFKVMCDMALTREVQHIGEISIPWDKQGMPR
jgi:hypothetical protein